jgi:hypothetical protein
MDTLKPTRLICEKSGGSTYLYMEDESANATNELKRRETLRQLDFRLLDLECDLSAYADNVYFVLPLDPGA